MAKQFHSSLPNHIYFLRYKGESYAGPYRSFPTTVINRLWKNNDFLNEEQKEEVKKQVEKDYTVVKIPIFNYLSEEYLNPITKEKVNRDGSFMLPERGCCDECGEGFDNESEWRYNTECELCEEPMDEKDIIYLEDDTIFIEMRLKEEGLLNPKHKTGTRIATFEMDDDEDWDEEELKKHIEYNCPEFGDVEVVYEDQTKDGTNIYTLKIK
jgi:hypothetical protein